MLRLNEVGLCIFTKKSQTINTLEITDLGLKGIKIIVDQLNELIHTMPKSTQYKPNQSIKSINIA